MNERIKLLAEQAAQDTRIFHNNAYWRMQNELAEDATWREKFAELIVRECATTAAMFSIENKRIHPDIAPHDMPTASQMVYHSTCQAVSREIKEHFGVE